MQQRRALQLIMKQRTAGGAVCQPRRSQRSCVEPDTLPLPHSCTSYTAAPHTQLLLIQNHRYDPEPDPPPDLDLSLHLDQILIRILVYILVYILIYILVYVLVYILVYVLVLNPVVQSA